MMVSTSEALPTSIDGELDLSIRPFDQLFHEAEKQSFIMTTDSAINLLPPPIDIHFHDEPLPQCAANLMPFSIAYDGPAPIDSFLVQRSASSPSADAAVDDASESFISAFRGRAIQSTPLPLPPGFEAKVVRVSQVASTSGSASATGSRSHDSLASRAEKEAEEVERERERASKRRRMANQPPPKQQKFSMDSDDDDDDEERDEAEQDDDDSIAVEPVREPSPRAVPVVDHQPASTAGPTVRIEPIARVHPNHLTIWGPDGPIDKGDDPFFRTVGEWYSVVAPLVSANPSLARPESGNAGKR
ncbi:hypothetical protein PHSY_005474 [Pseudozyma hubeiensis SY62]|uniref:Uncharacterized protein n=1 Tax=Pseudozyma hubeiensis (strain SY62) TaxID=1305764 RepID=R9P955_PSEHS|nr:hypothetical protein PHSY_005474 [Pseudozyma hubeiensis SY62]GAC97886.1 hypothetical protein PHSY_005474 [Pseudozyma hubeiensis SY62]